ncbi:hypothetical protein LXL04_016446 [Taraxacum kok-saghyz]
MVLCKHSHDDDDFVRTPPPHSTIAVQVSSVPFPCVKTMFPPERLIHTLQLLNDQQTSYVEAIGFGSSLTIRLGKPPRMLSYWLVDRYNLTTNSIFVKGKTVVVTRDIIHDVLPIPMGDIPMSNPVKANHEDNVVRIWKSQFPKDLRRIRLTHVIQKIVTDSEAGQVFILNFLVLYVSVMIGFPSMGTVNQYFLENIKMDVDLFYIWFTKLDQGSEEIKTNPLLYWIKERLKDRELQEMAKGRFGNVVFSAHYNIKREQLFFMIVNPHCINDIASHGIKSEHKDTGDRMKKKDEHMSLEVLNNAITNLLNCHKLKICHFLQELVQIVNQTFNTYYQAKEYLDVLLETGLNNYPRLEAITQLIRTRNREFNEGGPYIPTDITRGMHHTPNNNQHPEQDDSKGNVENAGYNDAIVCTPLTQLLTTEVFDMLEESSLKSRGIQLMNEFDEDTNQDVHSPLCRHSKRYINLTDKLRSPMFVRIIDPNSGLKSIEARVSGMIFAGIGNECQNMGIKDIDIDDWDVNLEDEDEESDDQHIQLDDLWRKYVTKILTSDLNNLKASVYGYLPQYDDLPLEQKMEIDTNEHFDRMLIRIGFLD